MSNFIKLCKIDKLKKLPTQITVNIVGRLPGGTCHRTALVQ